MENNVKTWEVTYKHPFTVETAKTFVHARTKKEAVKKARENNVPARWKTFFWEIVSVEEFKKVD